MLTLPEQLLLLAMDDKKGTILRAAVIPIRFGLAGAAIMELALREKVKISDKKLDLVNDSYTGDNLLDEVINQFKNTNKSKSASDWIIVLANKENIQKLTVDSLVNKGIFEAEEHKTLGVFNSTHYPMKDSGEELGIKEKIRRVVLYNNEPDTRVAVLIGLVNTCGLTNEIFSKDERKEAKNRIKEISNSDLISKTVADTIAAVQAFLFTVFFS
jgi:hypothetical protein